MDRKDVGCENVNCIQVVRTDPIIDDSDLNKELYAPSKGRKFRD
jgi:hypothetical protein